MKITLRLVISLLFVATLVASVFSYLQVQSERKNLTNELERRSMILTESFQETVEEILDSVSSVRLKRFVKRFANRERLVGMIIYDSEGGILASSPGLPSNIPKPPLQVSESIVKNQGISSM